MSQHAFLSCSGAPAWSRCPAKPWLEKDLPDRSSPEAREGTAAHELRAMCLTMNTDAAAYLGRIIEVEGDAFEVTDDMVGHIQKSIDVLRQFSGEMLVEVPIDIEHITSEAGAKGTADTVILDYENATIIVDDLKYGRGVPVDAEDNEQAVLYGAGALEQFSMLADWQHVIVRISQPRINNDSEWRISVDELRTRAGELAVKAAHILAGNADTLKAVPGEKQCRFCKAQATCPALLQTVMDEFEAVPEPTAASDVDLAVSMSKVSLIEGWANAVRAETERRLLAGTPVDGWKLVEGRRGARSWMDDTAVEEAMKAMRLRQDEMYSMKLISPTQAEKLLKKDSPKRWAKLEELITQSEGKPSVAPASDKRPALVVSATVDEFESLV